METLEYIHERLLNEQRTRFVAFGSSNTERRIHGLHWFDWLDLGLKQTFGRVHHFINAGLGGDTTQGLLARFEGDVAFYKPHVVFVTIGGNDAKPDSGIDASAYADNLLKLVALISEIGALPILQTYYAADVPNLEEPHGSRFLHYMNIVREIAAERCVLLIDHHQRWERLRLLKPQFYQSLMLDALHVNTLGNMVIGLDLIRTFKAQLAEDQLEFCAMGLHYQETLDKLSDMKVSKG